MFFLLLDFLHGISEREGDPPQNRQPASQNQTRLCAAICGRSGDGVGERHHRSPESALLGLCDPAVDESRGSSQPQVLENRFCLHSERDD